jgi:predicted RND superfamily exporter protein
MSIESFTRFLDKWKIAVVILTLAVVGVIAYGGKNITFSSNYRVFFDKSNEQMEAFELLQNTYSKSDNVLIALLPKSKDAFDLNTLNAVDDLTELAWQLPFSSRVDSLSNYQHTYAIEDNLIVEDLIDEPSQLSKDEIKSAKKIALNEPLIIKRLLSEKGDVTAVNVTVQMPDGNESAVRELMAESRALVSKMEKQYPDIEFALTGLAPLSNAFAESAERDITTLIPFMFGFIILTLGLLLRSITATFAVVIIIFLSIISAMGLFGWAGRVLSPPTTVIPTIVMTVAVADSVHILISFFHALRTGADKLSAMEHSLKLNFKAVMITSLTTALGFLTMNFSEVPPMREVGTTVAVGVVAAFVFSTTFMPAMILLLPIKAKVKKEKQQSFWEKYADFVIKNKVVLFFSSILISAALIAAIPLNRINDEFVEYFATSTDFRKDTDLVSQRLSGIYTIEFSLESEQSGGISEPQFIQDLDKFSRWLKTFPEVEHVFTISDTFKRLNKNMHGDDEAWYKIPEDKQLAAQYLLLYEMSLPFGLDLNDQINVDKSAIRLVATLQNIPSYRTLEIEKEAQAWLAANTGFHKSYDASPNIMFSHIGARNVRSIIEGSFIALVGISLLLLGVLRSFRLGLISLAPNLLPAAMAFGLWGIFNGNLGIALTSAVGMTLGIVVDDTVHFLVKYQVGRKEKGLDPADSIRYAFTHVGMALFVTTFVLVSGFLVLASSSFLMNAQQGIFTASTIAIALILDFVFLPSLLLLIEEKKNEKTVNAS